MTRALLEWFAWLVAASLDRPALAALTLAGLCLVILAPFALSGRLSEAERRGGPPSYLP